MTARVLHNTECPIWTAAHLSTGIGPQVGPDYPILCALDLGSDSMRVLEWACQLGAASGAPVSALHVTSPGQNSVPEARKGIESILRRMKAGGDIDVRSGDMVTIINSRLRLLQASLLIIARRLTHSRLHHVLCLAYEIGRTSPCPVVSV